MYHTECINFWFKKARSCPNCRKKWIPNPFLHIRDSNQRRNALTPQLAEELQHRLFLESIGVNSSQYRYNWYNVDTTNSN